MDVIKKVSTSYEPSLSPLFISLPQPDGLKIKNFSEISYVHMNFQTLYVYINVVYIHAHIVYKDNICYFCIIAVIVLLKITHPKLWLVPWAKIVGLRLEIGSTNVARINRIKEFIIVYMWRTE